METENLLRQIKTAEKLIIYGAHLVALECARWLFYIGAGDRLLGFSVTNAEGNPEKLMGFTVRTVEYYSRRNRDVLLILAMPEKYHGEAETHAREYGFVSFCKMGLEKMSELKGAYLFEKQKNFWSLPFVLRQNENDPGWLDVLEKNGREGSEIQSVKRARHYKFPALFYLDEEEWIKKTAGFHFYKDYETVCGNYENLHEIPFRKDRKKSEEKSGKTLKIFMAFSDWDSKTAKPLSYERWIYPLQVGSCLSERKEGTLSDDMGETISRYNPLFAEMTGAYWIWKNETSSEYKGLCHYRRHFIISEEEILALSSNHVDVILSTPRYIPGGIKEMFLAETPVKETVLENMLRAVSELYAGERESLEEYLKSCFYYPNNMVIGKNNIYDSYCSWVFPVLFRMREIDVETGYGHEKDRHIAYAAELLTSYYFVKYEKKYHIAVTDYRYIM